MANQKIKIDYGKYPDSENCNLRVYIDDVLLQDVVSFTMRDLDPGSSFMVFSVEFAPTADVLVDLSNCPENRKLKEKRKAIK